MEREQLASNIQSWLIDWLEKCNGKKVNAGESLSDIGVESIELIDLIFRCEMQFNLRFPLSYLRRDHLRSLEALSHVIAFNSICGDRRNWLEIEINAERQQHLRFLLKIRNLLPNAIVGLSGNTIRIGLTHDNMMECRAQEGLSIGNH